MADKTKATEYFKNGYNCAQAVLLTVAPEIGMDTETAAAFTSGFGQGMGGTREVCGAVCALIMAASYITGPNKEDKGKAKAMSKELMLKFKEIHGSYICKELLGLVPCESCKEKHSCLEMMETAVELFNNIQK